MNVTKEMRDAVHLDDCMRWGHQFDFNNVVRSDTIKKDGPDKPSKMFQEIDSGDEFKLPYVSCYRCDGTWILPPAMGMGYEDAERILYDWIKPDHPLAKLIVRNRGKRKDRDSPKPPKGPDK